MKRSVRTGNASVRARAMANRIERLVVQCARLDCALRLDGKRGSDGYRAAAKYDAWDADWSAERKAEHLQRLDDRIAALEDERNELLSRMCVKDAECAVNLLAQEREECFDWDGGASSVQVSGMSAAFPVPLSEEKLSCLSSDCGTLGNGILSVRLDAKGRLCSLYRTDVKRQFLSLPVKELRSESDKRFRIADRMKPYASRCFIEGCHAVCENRYDALSVRTVERISLGVQQDYLRLDYAIDQRDYTHALVLGFGNVTQCLRRTIDGVPDSDDCDWVDLTFGEEKIALVFSARTRVKQDRRGNVSAIISEPREGIAFHETPSVWILPHLGEEQDSRARELCARLREPLILCDRTPKIRALVTSDSPQTEVCAVWLNDEGSHVTARIREIEGSPCQSVIRAEFRAQSVSRVDASGRLHKITAKELSFAAYETIELKFEL